MDNDEQARTDEPLDRAPPPPPPLLTASVPSQGDEEEDDDDEDYEEEEEEEEAKNEDDELIAKALKLIEKITSSPENPNPAVLHALATLFETQESQFLEENGHVASNSRSSHNIGRLGNVVRENDDFFELISSTYLSGTSYPVSVQAAATRLLLSCSVTWIIQYPHVLDEDVMNNVKNRVMEKSPGSSCEDHGSKHESRETLDSQMLKTYSTGLLAYLLTGGGSIVEDVLTSRLSAELMRYLRIRVLGETSSSQKESGHLPDGKNVSGANTRVREEGRNKARQVLEVADERPLDELTAERNHERIANDQAYGEDLGDDGRPDSGNDEDRWRAHDLREGKAKLDDIDENGRDDTARRKLGRGWMKSRGKIRSNEGFLENEQPLTSPVSGRSNRDKSSSRALDVKKVSDAKKYLSRNISDLYPLERGENDDCFQDCRVGNKDFSDLVKKAVMAAEAEARAANAPEEAVKAAGDAAAEAVKSAAIEEFKTTNSDEAAVSAASRVASTVIDAANAVEISRKSLTAEIETVKPNPTETEPSVDVEEYSAPDADALAKLREKYCIQCLERLGEYVEVLGPVLHEKGVDVCLGMLQQNSKHTLVSEVAKLLPDIMKLICALAAHRKFAALFVDRGGMQKLLALPRVALTFFGLSSCLFTIGSLQGIMERVCALPSGVINQLVELALQLLECPQDQARKNAALFFSAAFVFRAVIDAFDSQDGLQKVLGHLKEAASVRSGVNSSALGLSASGSVRNERSPAEVLTSSEKQIAYHTCVALRQYFRAHLLLLIESIRPNKSNRSAARNVSSVRAAYKPLDISNEALDAVFLQLQKDRKLGLAFVRSRWPAVEKFLGFSGHIIMLELCQAPPVERYLHDLLQFALGVLHIITLVPNSRKLIVSATLSNNRVGIAVILDAASVAGSYMDPEIIHPALNVLVNLVCPPPSISNRPPLPSQGQQSAAAQTTNGLSLETRERNVERNVQVNERGGESAITERGSASILAMQGNLQAAPPTPVSGLVGDRRISLGAGAGCAGLATQLEQGYRQAREAVRANNGIKVLLGLINQRVNSPPLDCLRALACRVLLGLARDDVIAHILTKLQVGKKLSDLIRETGSQANGTQGRWQTELSQAAIELIGIVTNSGRASTFAASDAATPTLRRIERAAIAAATPITYHSRELLLLIHEHLQASGLGEAASTLLREAQLTPLPSLAAPSSLAHQTSAQESSSLQFHWPFGRAACGFLTNKSKLTAVEEDSVPKLNPNYSYLKKKQLLFSPSFGSHSRSQDSHHSSSLRKLSSAMRQPSVLASASEPPTDQPSSKPNADAEAQCKTPITLPLKRKLTEMKEVGLPSSSAKRLHNAEQGLKSPVGQTPNTLRKHDAAGFSTPSASSWRSTVSGFPSDYPDDNQFMATPSSLIGFQTDAQNTANSERVTLDSLVVQYLKHQHRQCPAPITTLPPLSLLQPHVCPEPKRSLEAPSNVTSRLGIREFKSTYSGVHGNRRDRQFVYSRFRPWRTCRDDSGAPLTCVAFLGDTSHIAVGVHSGEVKIFDANSNTVLESCHSHQSPVTIVQSYVGREAQLLLSSSASEVRLWDAAALSGGPTHPFEGCKAAKFSNSGDIFAALSAEQGRREILLFDIATCQEELKLVDATTSSTGRGSFYSLPHFNPLDMMILWNGVLWDRRLQNPVYRFDQFTDYGGGGFHPAGNEVIINSEVWDLRKFRLLRSVPSLDQTTITFNARGDVIYAYLRRNFEDVMSAFNTRRSKHPLFSAFRTLDAINYSDIATIPVDRCVLDFAAEPTDSSVGLITMDDQEEMYASARVYEIGRRRPTDDDSDPDDAESEDEDDEDDDDDDVDIDPLLGPDINLDGDSDGGDMSNDDDSLSDLDDDDDDGDFMDELGFGGGGGIFGLMTDGEDDGDDSQLLDSGSSDEDDFVGNSFGY